MPASMRRSISSFSNLKWSFAVVTISVFLLNGNDPEVYSMTDGIVREDRNIPLDAAIAMADSAPFWNDRGKAIEAYAQLEQSLCSLFAFCCGITRELAAIIFFKITNSQARNSIIERVVRQKYEDKYNLFLNSYLKQLREIDIKRNEIVHWIAAAYVALNVDNCVIVGVGLVPPSYWAHKADTPRILPSDLAAFSDKCGVFARLCTMFHGFLSEPPGLVLDAAWQDIFQQPLVYPLPEGHPLNRRGPEPNIQPQPSQE